MTPLNELLTLTRPLHVLDLETTGVVEGSRIVEIGFQTWTAEGLKHGWKSLVNPQIPILNTKNHHVTDDDVQNKCWKCGHYKESHTKEGMPTASSAKCTGFQAVPTFTQLAPRLATGFSNCDFAGKNVRFDLGILYGEMKRVGVEWNYAGACVIDAERLEQIGEPRTLTALYKKHTGKDLKDAHHALDDVQATSEVIGVQLQRYKQVLSRDPRVLHELQWPGWIDAEGKFRFDKDGVPRCMFGKHRGEAMQTVPIQYYQWLIRSNFSSEVEALSRDACLGVFPTMVKS